MKVATCMTNSKVVLDFTLTELPSVITSWDLHQTKPAGVERPAAASEHLFMKA
jgi:hypothetical protein